MDPFGMDDLAEKIPSEEIPGALRLLDVMVEAGRESPKEAAAWRLRLLAWQEFHRFLEANDAGE